jgi:hypothetical protein
MKEDLWGNPLQTGCYTVAKSPMGSATTLASDPFLLLENSQHLSFLESQIHSASHLLI